MGLGNRLEQLPDADFPQASEVLQWAGSLEAGAAVELQPVHVAARRQWRREGRRRGAVDSVHVRADGSSDVHQAGVVTDRLLGVTEQVDDVLE